MSFIRDLFFKKNENKTFTPKPESNYQGYQGNVKYGRSYPVVNTSFDGEKNLGELGVIKHIFPDYEAIRLRAYQAETETDIIRIITERFFNWVVGSGLKLQVEPNEDFLEIEGINEDFTGFKKIVKARFDAWSNSSLSDYSNKDNLHVKALEAYQTSFIGGDCLVVCRVENNNLNVQVIDGIHVSSPIDSTLLKEVEERGNFVLHGIEYNVKGEHIAYFVKNSNLTHDRVAVYGESTTRKLAWLKYGRKLRVDHLRGVSELMSNLEKLSKLDRYVEASVGKAEQASKITYAIEHSNYSTGEDLITSVVNAKKNLTNTTDNPYVLGETTANRIIQTTNNQTFNMPIGATLKPFSTDIETNFDDFFKSILNTLCASVGIPPEVAMQMYNSNYSASRASINSFAYIVELAREKEQRTFYKPIYELWLEVEVLKNKIPSNGLITAILSKDILTLEAYANCRFIGRNMPHIDPLKEVKAVSEMLSLGLISKEQATEMLNVGDWWNNQEKIEKENESYPPKQEVD